MEQWIIFGVVVSAGLAYEDDGTETHQVCCSRKPYGELSSLSEYAVNHQICIYQTPRGLATFFALPAKVRPPGRLN